MSLIMFYFWLWQSNPEVRIESPSPSPIITTSPARSSGWSDPAGWTGTWQILFGSKKLKEQPADEK